MSCDTQREGSDGSVMIAEGDAVMSLGGEYHDCAVLCMQTETGKAFTSVQRLC